jgi:alpha-mannosidase
VDLSEGDYGVSLLNDCKYGHDIRDNVMRITLLRSPSMPDPTADFGEHEFKYSLYPHVGGWNEETQREAYLLNDPILVYQRTPDDGSSIMDHGPLTTIPPPSSMISASQPNVIIETVKRAEDGGGIIVRLYESRRKRGKAQLQMGFPLEAAWETNLLEENQTALHVENDAIQLDLKPYQIMTLRLKSK